MMLDEKSRDLTAFSNPWGKIYRYKRLNMGLCIASELYQEKMSGLLNDLNNVKVAIDDILVMGRTKKEHDECLDSLLKRLVKLNLTLSSKSEFYKEEVSFFGMVISGSGIQPNRKKMKDLIEANAPKNKAELESFLGLATYFHERIIKFAEISEPLRKLKSSSQQWSWLPEHQQAFDALKKAMYTKCLGHFKLSDPTELWVDASGKGVAAFLVQSDKNNRNDRRIISYASKSFSKAEQNYSQVEREGYACVWAVEHFHFYLFGQPFDLMTDNKSMMYIFENDCKLKQCSKRITVRLQCWRSRLTQYPRMKCKHIKGKTNIADFYQGV